jgi:hypothetical protein
VRENVVFGVGMGLHLHGAPRNLVENNLFAYCSSADIAIQPEEYNVGPMNTTVRRNIFAWGRGKLFSTGEGWNKNWHRQPIGEMDRNIYWREGGAINLGRGHLEGFDKHSIVAAPKLTVERNGKLIIQAGEAARKLGIEPIDLTGVGLTERPQWVRTVPTFDLQLPLPPDALSALPGFQPWRSNARTPAPSDAVNRLENPKLDAGNDEPADWHPIWWGTSKEKNESDRDPKSLWVKEGPDGSRCFKITSADRGRMASRQGGWRQNVPSPGPGRYLLRFDVKAEDLAIANPARGGSFSAYVHIVNRDGSHGRNLGADQATLRGGSFDWLRREVVIDVPQEAKKLTVIFQFQRMTGTVWIDNVQLIGFEAAGK